MKPTSWSVATFEAYEKREADKIQTNLNRFVTGIYKRMEVLPGKIKCIIKSSVLTNSNIREYAETNKFSYICISTRGAGKSTAHARNSSHVYSCRPRPCFRNEQLSE